MVRKIRVFLIFLGLSLYAEDAYLFVDNTWVATQHGLRRVIHAGKKLPKPVLEPERPWEGDRIYIYGSAHYDKAERVFRMWYKARLGIQHQRRVSGLLNPVGYYVLHATSPDGLNWTRPDAGVCGFDGSRANNIVFDYDSPSVIVDEQAPDASQRYKMVGHARGRAQPGYWAAVSADGLHWRDCSVNPIIKSSDTITLARDPSTGEFMAFHKRPAEVRGYSRRTVWLSTSRDFQHWTNPEMVLAPDETDDAWTKEPKQRTEFYVMSVFPYAKQFLGLISVFRVTRERSKEDVVRTTAPGTEPPSRHDGPIDIQLVTSRDGHHWERTATRKPVIELGSPGSFDAGCIPGVSNPVIHNDEIWVYYTGVTTTHGGAFPAKRMVIGRASWRLDGFVSLDAEKSGWLETVPMALGGKRLTINAEAQEGAVHVEVRGPDGRPVKGFTKSDCQVLSGNGIRQQVRWNGGGRIPPGSAVRLRICMTTARLYGLRTTD